jgi:hypothetical protein
MKKSFARSAALYLTVTMAVATSLYASPFSKTRSTDSNALPICSIENQFSNCSTIYP